MAFGTRIQNKRKESLEVLEQAYQTFGNNIVYACSFGAEGVVLIDLISRVNERAEIVFLDTQFHFKETHELIDKVREHYPKLRIHLKKPRLSPEGQAEKYGERLWESNPDLCCGLRKIDPLKQALAGREAWISGLRREQSAARSTVQFYNDDHKFGLKKICPLIYWTWEEIWAYIEEHGLAYNPLHDRGYPSIGCE
ncbi:MAG TPA: phosphoadenylyl-sulfate reductase, partial [Bacillales bacterium]|nr:phosphoadenylyl-sulfate reductase [Bacillales bacterium]